MRRDSGNSSLPWSPHFLDIPIHRVRHTDRHMAFFINHPGVVEPADQADCAEIAAQILRRDADRDGHVKTAAGGGPPKQRTVWQQTASRQTVARTVEIHRPSLAVV